MFNIRRLTLLALVVFIATTTYARPNENPSNQSADVNSPERQEFYKLFPITEKCRTAVDKYDYSECLINLNSYTYNPIKDEDIPKLKTACSRQDRCSIARVNAAMDDIEKNCAEDLKYSWPEAVDAYQLWTDLPYRYAAQCTKVGDKYCAVEKFHGVNCDDCQRAVADAVRMVRFNREPVYGAYSVTPTLLNNAKIGDTTFEDEDTEVDEEEEFQRFIDEFTNDDEDVSSATGLYTNILGTSLVVLSTIVLSQ
jgi:hypothetical protein